MQEPSQQKHQNLQIQQLRKLNLTPTQSSPTILTQHQIPEVAALPLSILVLTELNKQETVEITQDAINFLQDLSNSMFIFYSEDQKLLHGTILYDKYKQVDKNNGEMDSQQKNQQSKTRQNKQMEQIEFDYILCIGENNTMMRAFKFDHIHRFSKSKSVQQQLKISKNAQDNAIKSKTKLPGQGDTNKEHKNIPILSISDGDEPIMSSYSICQIYSILENFVQRIKSKTIAIKQNVKFDAIQRFGAFKKHHFSCELELHRDMTKSVLRLKIYVKFYQQKNFLYLANLWGDGVIISTPLGSMGRNINLSGPIIYKNMQSLTILPINPLSLNFRPIIIPSSAQILIQVEQTSRSPAQLFSDRELVCLLDPKCQIVIKKSMQTCRFVKSLSSKSSDEQWINCLQDVLSWGQPYYDPNKKVKRLNSIARTNSNSVPNQK